MSSISSLLRYSLYFLLNTSYESFPVKPNLIFKFCTTIENTVATIIIRNTFKMNPPLKIVPNILNFLFLPINISFNVFVVFFLLSFFNLLTSFLPSLIVFTLLSIVLLRFLKVEDFSSSVLDIASIKLDVAFLTVLAPILAIDELKLFLFVLFILEFMLFISSLLTEEPTFLGELMSLLFKFLFSSVITITSLIVLHQSQMNLTLLELLLH